MKTITRSLQSLSKVFLLSAVAVGFTIMPFASAFTPTVQAAPGNANNLVINEINTEGTDDWIELYNPGPSTVGGGGGVIGQLTVRDSDGNDWDLSTYATGTIAAGEYVVIDVGNALNNAGDEVEIFYTNPGNSNEEVIDNVAYGDHGSLSTPDSGETLSRIPNGSGDFESASQTKAANNDPDKELSVAVDYCDPSQKPGGMDIAEWHDENDFDGSSCFGYEVDTQQCGSLDVQFTENDTPFEYSFRYAIGTTTPTLGNWEGDGELPVNFDEDEYGGSVDVTYYVTGPEEDYFTGSDTPNIWDGNGETVTVDTDCEDKQEETIVVTGDTAAGENQEGWLFNRDSSTATEFEFNTDENVIGSGSLNVFPIDGSLNGDDDKFIGEYFWLGEIADLESFSYDFKIGSGGDDSDDNHFYLNVYANFAESSDTNYYDCRYDIVPTSGSTGSFTTLTFDPEESYPVTKRSSSPHECPSVPADMDDEGEGSTIRAFAINLGDTSANDAGLDGYFDKVVLDTNSKKTTFDFEPEAEGPQVCEVTIYSDETNTVAEESDAPAVLLSDIHDHWTGEFDSAEWIWSDDPVQDPFFPVTRTFEKKFGFNGVVTDVQLEIASDNTYYADLNGNSAGDGVDVDNFSSLETYNLATSTINQGNNLFSVEVTNTEGATNPQGNPAGLLYKLTITGEGENCEVPYEEPEQCEIEYDVDFGDDTDIDENYETSGETPGAFTIRKIGDDYEVALRENADNDDRIAADGVITFTNADLSGATTTPHTGNDKFEDGSGNTALDTATIVGNTVEFDLQVTNANDVFTITGIEEDCGEGQEPEADLVITKPAVDDETLAGTYTFEAEYTDGDSDDDPMQWAIRAGTCAPGTDTVAGNVDGFSTDHDWDGASFSSTIDMSGWDSGEYCFVVNPTEDSGPDLRETRTFELDNSVIEPIACEDGDILHLDTEAGELFSVDDTSGTSTLEQTYGDDFHGVLADKDDVLYSIKKNGEVVTLGASSTVTELGINVDSDLPKPVAGDFAADGLLYIVDQQEDKLYTLDVDTGTVDELGSIKDPDNTGSLGINGGDLVVSNDGGGHIIYVHKNGTVYSLDVDNIGGTYPVGADNLGSIGSSMHITSATKKGDTYYALDRDDTLYTFEISGSSLTNIVISEDTGPYSYGDATCAEAPVDEIDDPEQCTATATSDLNEDPSQDNVVDTITEFIIDGTTYSNGDDFDMFVLGDADADDGVNGDDEVRIKRTADGFELYFYGNGSPDVREFSGSFTLDNVDASGATISVGDEPIETGGTWSDEFSISTTTGTVSFTLYTNTGNDSFVVNGLENECSVPDDEDDDTEEEDDDNNEGGGGSSLSSSSNNSRVLGDQDGDDGQVLGEQSGQCEAYLNDFMHPRANNNTFEVLKLQLFLNVWMDAGLQLTQVYDRATEAAVRAFQDRYADEVLTPWGLTEPTGYVYVTTKAKINSLLCSRIQDYIPNPLVPDNDVTDQVIGK